MNIIILYKHLIKLEIRRKRDWIEEFGINYTFDRRIFTLYQKVCWQNRPSSDTLMPVQDTKRFKEWCRTQNKIKQTLH